MKKMKSALLTLIISLLGSSNAHATFSWYGGIGAGGAHIDDLDMYGENIDKNGAVLSMFGGLNLNQNFGVELGYLYAGKGGVDGVDFETQGVTLSGITYLPVDAVFSGVAEAGLYADHTTAMGKSDNGYSPLVGLGVNARMTDFIDVQARYRYLWNVGGANQTWETNMGVATLELVMHPGRNSYSASIPKPAPTPIPESKLVSVEQHSSLRSDALFAFGQSTLTREGLVALEKFYLEFMKKKITDSRTVIVGYTDRIGTDKDNQVLSEARARSVADFFINRGVDISTVRIEGRGEANPVSTDQCRDVKGGDLITCLAPDRRVEVHITGVQQVQM